MNEISVVIPTFNHKQYLSEAINSIKNSSIEVDIIVVNDGSTDGTLEMLEEIKDITVYNQQNHGSAYALNVGIEKSKTNFIAILNDDDIYHRKHLEKIINLLNTRNSDLIISWPEIFGSGEKFNQVKDYPKAQRISIENRGLFWSLFDFNWTLSTSAFVLRKELWDRGLKFRNFSLCHDLDFVLRAIIKYSAVVSIFSEPSWSYRCHGSNSGSAISKNLSQVELAVCLVDNLLKLNPQLSQEMLIHTIGYGLPYDLIIRVFNYLKENPIEASSEVQKVCAFFSLQL